MTSRSMQRVAAKANRPRWWQQEEERCTFCLQCHAHTFEVHCTRCDVVSCRSCAIVVITTNEVLCPTCSPDLGPGAGDEER